VRFGWCEKLDARRDVVYMLSDIFWEMVFIAGRNDTTGDRIFIFVIFSVKEVFCLLRRCVKCEPSFVIGMRNSGARYTIFYEPTSDFILCRFGRTKSFNDFF
jgi:hypothetical protein